MDWLVINHWMFNDDFVIFKIMMKLKKFWDWLTRALKAEERLWILRTEQKLHYLVTDFARLED